MASEVLSMAVGAVAGAVKPVTDMEAGRVGAREERQAVVMEGVELGFMRRMEMALVEVPVMEGKGVIVGRLVGLSGDEGRKRRFRQYGGGWGCC